jgi:uncharacterized protein (TIGR03382 family)
MGSSARASFSDVSLGSAGPSGLNLTLFVTGPTTFSASNSGTLFQGNLGLSSGASTNVSGGGSLTGNVFKDPGATIQGNFSGQFNVGGMIITMNMSQAVSDVQAAWATAMALTADQTFGAIGASALTINASGPLNAAGGHNTVVEVNGGISIGNSSKNLTIHGGANDFFIINVTGDINVTNGKIQATGGIPSSHILFNLSGNMNDLSVSNGTSELVGTYLAPNPGQKIQLTPGHVDGALIAYQIQTSSGPTVVSGTYYFPAPGTAALFALGGMVLGRRRR